MLPYREAELIRLCAQCKEEASAHCLRCGDPVCPKHDGGSDRRCDPCESEFLSKKANWQNTGALIALVLTIVCFGTIALAAATYSGSISYPAALYWLLAAPFAAWGGRAMLPGLARKKFLGEQQATAKALAGNKTSTKLLPEKAESAE